MAALPKTEPKSEPKPAPDTDAPDADSAAEAGAGGKGRGKLLIIFGIVVAVLGIGGGAAFYFLRAAPTEAAAGETAAATPTRSVAIYLNLRPDFIVNSTAVGQRRYLQTVIDATLKKEANLDGVESVLFNSFVMQ